MKKILIYFIIVILSGITTSCSEDELTPSIFDPAERERTEFDKWILENYVDEYNIDFKYLLDDIETNMSYNLIPADINKAKDLAKIIVYLWLESYNEYFDPTGNDKHFMREYAPKVIQLVGSAAINASSNTEVLGTAEGGIKIVLYKVNSIDPANVDMLNDYYFGTMHHEFAHILHQKEEIPIEFNNITPSGYSSTGWQNRTEQQAWSMGFVTPYASKEPHEDFVEIIANYLVKSDEYWQNMMEQAGESGAGKIQQKFDMVEEWLLSTWEIDIHELRNIISRRAANIESVLNK